MSYQFRPAVRTYAKPLIGFYGQSGSGKTYSALWLARGLVGPKGKIAMIDTESGRGQLYADVIDGGYDAIDLGEPFSPARYIEAITAAENHSADVVVIDSASHEWEGVGGVLDMAAQNEARSGKPGLHNWKDPKVQHQKFVLKLLASKTPIIVCLRAKFKTRQVKNEKTNKSEIVRDDYSSPIQADDFIYEMTVHAELQADHSMRVTKCSHPGLRDVFQDGGRVTLETGRALAEWAQKDSQRSAPKAAKKTPEPERPAAEPEATEEDGPPYIVYAADRQLEFDDAAEWLAMIQKGIAACRGNAPKIKAFQDRMAPELKRLAFSDAADAVDGATESFAAALKE